MVHELYCRSVTIVDGHKVRALHILNKYLIAYII